MKLNDKFETAPHFCRDGHEPIRHWDDSEDDLCPLCRSQMLAEEVACMLAYWLPREEPLVHQTDEPSMEHKRKYREAQELLGRVFPPL